MFLKFEVYGYLAGSKLSKVELACQEGVIQTNDTKLCAKFLQVAFSLKIFRPFGAQFGVMGLSSFVKVFKLREHQQN